MLERYTRSIVFEETFGFDRAEKNSESSRYSYFLLDLHRKRLGKIL